MGTQLPYRIELFDDEVETLRTFDVDSQRTLFPVPEIRLLPAREFPPGDMARTKFRCRFRETFEGDASRIALYKDVSNGGLPAASSITCRSFSMPILDWPHCSIICRRMRRC